MARPRDPHTDIRTLGARYSWQGLAACASMQPEIFFPDLDSSRARLQVARAKAICAECAVREACLAAALDLRERSGIWGGMTPRERSSFAARRAGR